MSAQEELASTQEEVITNISEREDKGENMETPFENVQLSVDIQPYNQNVDVDIPGACAICSIAFAINATLTNDPERRVTLESVLDLSISNEQFSTRGNGTHPIACVEIGKLFGRVEWGYFGEKTNGFELIRRQLKKGLPVIVGVKMNLLTLPSDIGHAVVITGIDEKNRVTIADSFSRISTRQGKRKQFPFGKPIWVAKPGFYQAEWLEFDASWNTKDDYMSMSYEGDPAFVSFNPNVIDYRFWMTIDTSNF